MKGKESIKRARNRGIIAISVVVVITVAVGSVLVLWHPTGQASNPLFECVGEVGYHIHAHLTYEPLGIPMTISALVGYRNGCFLPMHTHQPDGFIHIESARDYHFDVLDFFEVWGVNVTYPNQPNIVDVSHCSIASSGPTFILSGCGEAFSSNLGYILQNGDNVTVS